MDTKKTFYTFDAFDISDIFDKTDSLLKKTINFLNPKKSKLRIIFMGTPEVAVPFLKKIIEIENVVAVFTSPDLPAGRHMKIKESPIKIEAKKNNIKTFQPNYLKDEKIIKQIQSLQPDLIITVAYGYKIPDVIINIPTFKSINIHFSLLPKYRGAAPVNWAIINGEKETGVSSFYLCDKMDAGDLIYQKQIPITDEDTSETLMSKLIDVGLQTMEETISGIKNKTLASSKQNEISNIKTKIAPKLKKLDGKINWSLSNTEIINKMRGLVSWPGAYTHLDSIDNLLLIKLFEPKIHYLEEEGNIPGEVLNISKDRGILVKCGSGAIWIKKVQLEGHKIVSGYEFYVGRKIQKGDIFES
jgi:methionyl-tRNA formyltransferase